MKIRQEMSEFMVRWLEIHTEERVEQRGDIARDLAMLPDQSLRSGALRSEA